MSGKATRMAWLLTVPALLALSAHGTLLARTGPGGCLSDIVESRLDDVPEYRLARLERVEEGVVAILVRGEARPVLVGIGLRLDGGRVLTARHQFDADLAPIGLSPEMNGRISRLADEIRRAPDTNRCADLQGRGDDWEAAMAGRIRGLAADVLTGIAADREAAGREAQAREAEAREAVDREARAREADAASRGRAIAAAQSVAGQALDACLRGLAEAWNAVLLAIRFVLFDEAAWPLFGDRLVFPLALVVLPLLLAGRRLLAVRSSRRRGGVSGDGA